MNNRWKMNRIGFINFWLYDEEIFNLENGKILIRGTNGSGKSITTQSVVSFILDGDRSPERLDTFGSTSRKMEYYFLGDGEKEDETGYIFLELKKENVEQYLTIGIGQRAQKGKSMSFWGFILSDGRRVGEEFKLYREIGNKRIPLSKNELERLLGDKNKIAYGQRDYMDMINKELFGFSDINYYKKLIKFLLKIRTSKLSTDIKPMNVYEILNDSLQVLEERDLRVLVESLEKMDSMQKRNEEQKEVQRSINIIKKEYDKYNRFILGKKATTYFEAKKEYEILRKTIDKLIKEIERLKKESKDNNEIKVKIEKRIGDIEQENRILESIDLEKTVNEMLITRKELQNKEKEIKEEEEKLEEHNVELKKQGIRKREEENRIETIKYKIKKLHQELKDINEVLLFEGHLKDENEIFQKEIAEKLESIKNNLEVYQKNINLGLEALEKMKNLSEDLEKEEEEVNSYRNERDRIKDEMLKAQGMEERARDNLVENFYILKEKNEFLKISKSDLDKIIELIKKYEGLIEAGEIKKILEKNYNLKSQELQHSKMDLEHAKIVKTREYEVELEELNKLKNLEDNIPVRKDEVIQCREELKKSGIEFMAFYETVDFSENLSEIEKNTLEAQLKDSGILDSLVIPYEKRERAKDIISKYSDIIITSKKNSDKNFKYNKLVPENIKDNIKEVIEDFFKNISPSEQEKNEGIIILEKEGYFKNGVLEGYSSSKEEASFIGIQTRKEKLQKYILEKEEKCANLLYEIENFDLMIEEISNKISVLIGEYKNVPLYDDLDTSIKLKKDTEYAFQKIKNELEIREDKLNRIKTEYREWNQKVITRCRILPFEKKITEYKEAEIASKEYLKNIYELENQLRNYQSSKYEIIRTEEMEGKSEELIEFYRDKIRKGKNELEKYQKAIEKLQEILNSPENVAAAEKLKNLKEEKLELKEQYDKADRNIIRIDTTIQGREEILNSENEKVETKERAVEKTLEYYKEELSLGYVVQYEKGEEEELLEEILKNVKDNEKTIEGITVSLMKKFNDNSSRLYEYMAATEEIFEDDSEYCRKRIYIRMINNGKKLSLYEFEKILNEEIEQREYAIEREDRKLIVDILSGNIGHKLNDQIYESRKWIKEMSKIMSEMETSMKMKFSMEWKPKEKLNESELEINELEILLRKDGKLLPAEDLQKISEHFKSKLNLIREEMKIKGEEVNYIDSIREILDYRKWFEFRIYYHREGENKKELTNNAFNRFSGGEKAMSIYIPLLAAASAQYKKAKEDCPRIIALDEAFAGIDDKNISSMFELIDKLDFDYIMNSQILWGCYETVKKLRIAELINRRDLKMVKVNHFYWDGKKKTLEM